MWNARKHADLIPETRALLRASRRPYVIENVPGAPLEQPFMLCGSHFGLATACGAQLQRHRYFEANWFVGLVPDCQHGSATLGVYGEGARDLTADKRRRVITVTGRTPQQNVIRNQVRKIYGVAAARIAMGIDWMTMAELCQAIPPAYSEWIGRAFMDVRK
jgi:DNA (cytosine-5)-methyltransferase 1